MALHVTHSALPCALAMFVIHSVAWGYRTQSTAYIHYKKLICCLEGLDHPSAFNLVCKSRGEVLNDVALGYAR